MKLHNKIKAIGLAVIASMTLVSCDVELLPLDTVILENYWTNKEDVQSVVYSCYSGLCSSDVVNRMIVWGEVRSDNVQEGQQISSAGNDLKYILNGNVLETNSYCTWACFYKIINRCNTVELYAPLIQERDPNYTESDLKQTLIEVKAIRDLCYFYLIRTFGDVPFTFTPSIEDDQVYVIPATKQELILDTLIMDLEEYAQYAPKRYVEENENSGRISRNGVYAMLADMYLWKASNDSIAASQRNTDYLKCVEYCDKVIEAKIDEYKEDRYGSLKRQISKDIYAEYGYPLIEEWAEGDQSSGTGVSAKAYNLIFGSGHSFESLFELSFSSNSASSGTTNSAISNMYGNHSNLSGSTNSGAYLAANETMMSNTPTAAYSDDNVFTSYDFRGQESFRWDETAAYTILKYVIGNDMKVNVGAASQWSVVSNEARSENYANWIIYRLTDVMLMKAEAEVQIADYIDNSAATDTTASSVKTRAVYGNVYSTSKEYLDDVFNIVDAIYTRSNPKATGTQKPVQSSYNSTLSYENLVENERRRELMFEGKRYFDLLRRARREGSTSYTSSKLSSKYTNAKALGIKMSMLEFLYMPYAEDELKRNKLLEQNPAYDKEEKNERNI